MQIFSSNDSKDKAAVRNQLIAFNHNHFPVELSKNYQEANFFVKNDAGDICGGVLSEVCWNWVEVHILFLDESLRKQGYGSKLMEMVEQLARDKQCDFIKLDTLSFQALDFYKKLGFVVYGQLDNAGGHTHYYLKKDLL